MQREEKMKIEVIKKIPFSELVEKVRSVPLVKADEGGSPIFVYGDARISLRELHPEEVNPTTFYLMREGIQFQRDLREALLDGYGIDTLMLDEGYEIKNENGDIWGLIPPVIEVAERRVKYVPKGEEIRYDDEVTLKVPIINDGAHRVWLAREGNETFNALYISGINPVFPFYAHPNEWQRVKIVDEVPKKEEKKFYSREDNYALYRDFGVLGCGAPRKASK